MGDGHMSPTDTTECEWIMSKKTGAGEYNFPFRLGYCGGIFRECQKNKEHSDESQAAKEDLILFLVCRLLIPSA